MMAITVVTNVSVGDPWRPFGHGAVSMHFWRDEDPDWRDIGRGWNWALFCWLAERSPYGGRRGVPYEDLPLESREAFDRAFCMALESSGG